MCTVTWTPTDGGYDLFMNRDELHTRGRASPPAVRNRNGDVYVAPKDVDAGGTWIAVNGHGVIACLLNNFPAMFEMIRHNSEGRIDPESIPRGAVSRGEVPPALMSARSLDEVDTLVHGLHHPDFSPFYVFVLGPGTPGSAAASGPEYRLYRWDGEGELHRIEQPEFPVSTSSFMAKEVLANRSRVFQEKLGIDPERFTDTVATNAGGFKSSKNAADLIAYHRSHLPAKGPYSVCVHRDDAGTKSFSHVQVRQDTVTFDYVDGPPCEDGPHATVEIARK